MQGLVAEAAYGHGTLQAPARQGVINLVGLQADFESERETDQLFRHAFPMAQRRQRGTAGRGETTRQFRRHLPGAENCRW